MLKLLLDFPWPLHAALDSDPAPLKIIQDFLALLGEVPFAPAPFVDEESQAEFMQKLPNRRGRWIADTLRFLGHIGCTELGGNLANVVNGPSDLRAEWQRALRDQIGDGQNWRSPQIVVSTTRSTRWQTSLRDHEAEIVLEDEPNNTLTRVVFTMHSYGPHEVQEYWEDYRTHKYALSDSDPWDVRHIHYPLGERVHYFHCRLPRPGFLLNLSPDELDRHLHRLRSESWPHEGKYWYVPPGQWNGSQLVKNEWRSGAFPQDATLNPARQGKRGPVDYEGRVWLWHANEGHWDVQLDNGEHKRINQEGECLD